MDVINRILPERKCSLCGKLFIPAPSHRYRDKNKGTIFCSWHCFNHRNDNKPSTTIKAVEKCLRSGEIVEIYVSARVAAEQNNTDALYIREACRSGRVFKGYIWRYKNDLS